VEDIGRAALAALDELEWIASAASRSGTNVSARTHRNGWIRRSSPARAPSSAPGELVERAALVRARHAPS
jgi:hypothetical protein